jgi:peptidoglycan/LPS O-acetylase OafA/YrhL
MTNSTANASSTRNYYLDWLRVLSILCIFAYHTLRFFDPVDWHVKNAVTYFGINVVENIVGMWGMPLVFVISGASTFYSIRKSRAGKFLKDRALRLLVPLVVGVFGLAPVMVYLERVSHHQYLGSFFAWLPRYFHGSYTSGGNFAWMGVHLWYLEALFVLSLVLLPLFYWLRHNSGQRLLAWLGERLATPGMIFLLALPIVWLLVVLDPNGGILVGRYFGGWSLPIYVFFFLNGFLLVANERLQESAGKLRWVSLAASLALVAALLALVPNQVVPAFGTSRFALIFSLYGVASWCWVLAILGFGRKHLTLPTPWLGYANEAVLPFYILHQPVLLAIGFFVVKWQIPDLLKWCVIALVSLAIITVVYEFAIRRVNVLRFLFGMKPLTAKSAAQPVKVGAPGRLSGWR